MTTSGARLEGGEAPLRRIGELKYELMTSAEIVSASVLELTKAVHWDTMRNVPADEGTLDPRLGAITSTIPIAQTIQPNIYGTR